MTIDGRLCARSRNQPRAGGRIGNRSFCLIPSDTGTRLTTTTLTTTKTRRDNVRLQHDALTLPTLLDQDDEDDETTTTRGYESHRNDDDDETTTTTTGDTMIAD